MQQAYVIKLGSLYLQAVFLKGYGFSSERADAKEYPLDRAEQVAGDIIAKGLCA